MLTLDEQIIALRKHKPTPSCREVALKLGVSQSAVERCMKRNGLAGVIHASTAPKRYEAREEIRPKEQIAMLSARSQELREYLSGMSNGKGFGPREYTTVELRRRLYEAMSIINEQERLLA